MEDAKPALKKIRKELKERYPDKKYPHYLAIYIYCRAYLKLTKEESSKRAGKNPVTLWKWHDENIQEYLDDLKIVELNELREKIENISTKAVTRLEAMVLNADKDSTSLKAILAVLKSNGLLTETNKIELSGEVKVPGLVVEYFNLDEDDEDDESKED